MSGIILASAALTCCSPKTTPAPSGPPAPVRADGVIHIPDQPVPLNPNDPAQQTIDGFSYAGGLRIASQDTSLLGGLSDLKIAPDGALVSESDEGSLLRAHIRLDATGRLAGLDNARITQLTGLDGRPLGSKPEADAEGLAIWPNGDLMVSFERHHRIWLYPHAGGPPHSVPMPSASMPDNEGMEALALAPSQGPDAYWVGIEGGSIWLCHLKAACAQSPGQFPPAMGFRLTALGETPSGDLAVLHHSWNPLAGSRVTLSIIGNPAKNRAPKLIAALHLAPPLTLDNFEGVAPVARPGGTVRFYLISDDNFSDRQRTLLMAFDYKGPP